MDTFAFRSLLFVPGDSPKKLAKALDVPADALIVDWEDAVPPDRKAVARTATIEAMGSLASRGRTVLVRPNPVGTEFADADLRAVRECAPHGIVIAKCEASSQVGEALQGMPEGMRALALIESSAGVLQAASIAGCSGRVAGLMFGAEDYCAEVGIRRSDGAPELLYARGSVVNAARALRREVFESPLMQYKDLQAVRTAAWRARNQGFTGQAAIHPDQVPVINEVFLPAQAEIEAARQVLERYRAHGEGVYEVQGALEDRPAVVDASRILRIASRFGS